MTSYVHGAAVIFISILCYYNSLNCGFVFDDISAIKENRDLRPHSPVKNVFFNDFWGTPMHKEQSHKSYRPLCVLTFRWNFAISGLEPMTYHLVNMLLHALVSLMYYRMSTIILPDVTAFIAALLFAVHPIHTEAVTGVVGRAEILSSVFFLGAFIFYVKATRRKKSTGWLYLIPTVLSVSAAMLCKEQGITICGICAIYEIFVAQKLHINDIKHLLQNVASGKAPSLSTNWWPNEATRRLIVLCLSTLGLLFARLNVMGAQLPVFTKFDNPASVSSSPTRQLTYNYLVSVNLWLLLLPDALVCDWTMNSIELIKGFMDPRNLLTIMSYAIIGWLSWIAISTENRRKANVLIMGLAFMVLPFLPASNLFFPVGFVVAERVLYMPSMGFCLIVAYGFHLLSERCSKKAIWCCMALFILSHSMKTWSRNFDWETEYSIFMSGLRVNKRNAKLFNNVGHALESEGKFHEALRYFQAAVKVQKDDIGGWINVGRTYNHLKLYKEAENAYLIAKSLLPKAKPGESYQARIAPNHLNVFLNLANLISKNVTRLEEADSLYRQAISMRSDYTQAYINRGDILIKLNRTKEAQEVYERALLYDSANPDIYYNLGVVFLELNKPAQALAYLDKALEYNPEHEQALLNSAILLQELARPELRKIARERLMKLLEKDDQNERVFFNLGMLAMDDRNVEEAEHYFRRAIHIKEDFRSALFNLALLLADDHRPLEAAPFLNQLVKYHPDHVKGLILLGDIYVNTLKDIDAAEHCYKRILQLDPVNIQGLHNLCVVYVERGLLAKAHSCLNEAHKLAPNEDYIIKHIQIVETRLAKLKAQPSSTREKDLAFSDFDPREFGGRSTKQNKVNFKSLKSSTDGENGIDTDRSKIVQTSKDPVFLDSPATTDNFQKHESMKRIQNNYATDLDGETSGHFNSFEMEVDPPFCRVCFSQDESEEYLEILGNSAHVELMSVGNIEVFEGDPNLICKRCKVILSNSYKFKQICKRSENLLKTFPITKKIPPKIEIAQEELPFAIKNKKEESSEEKKLVELKETRSISVGNEHIELVESSTQTDNVESFTSNTCIEQMEMIIASDDNYDTAIPCIIAPPTLFEDESVNEQNTIMQNEKEKQKPKILSNEPVKILNKSLVNVTAVAPKQFKKKTIAKIDKIIPDNQPKILNTQLKLNQIKSPIIESIEETPDGNIEIITYGNEEYLEEEQILEDDKKPMVDDKSEDGVVYTCDVCDRSFPLLQQLEIHKQNHERARNFPCEYCEKAFFTKYDLAKHLLTHTKQKDYTCIVCKKSFSRSTLLYRHEKIHTDPNIPRYHCEHCDRVYLNSVDFEKHQITHNKNRPFACNYCDKRFAFKQGLERHEVIHDTKSMPHKCQYCPERFKTAARLQRHLSAAHAGTRAFPCSKCNKRFMLSHHLYRHMRTSHRNEDEDITIQCPECDITFEQREIFFEHCLEHVTTSLSCPMCKYKGEDHDDINAHVLLHCKSDMYFCDYCSCIFMTQEVLNEHFIEKHSEELCAIGEDEVELVVEKKPLVKEIGKRTREKTSDVSNILPKTLKRIKQEVQYVEAPMTGVSYVEFEEEIVEPVKVDKPKPYKSTRKEDVSKISPKKTSSTTTTTTIQRVKMSQSEIQRLQREGKIVVQDGMLIMKQ